MGAGSGSIGSREWTRVESCLRGLCRGTRGDCRDDFSMDSVRVRNGNSRLFLLVDWIDGSVLSLHLRVDEVCN